MKPPAPQIGNRADPSADVNRLLEGLGVERRPFLFCAYLFSTKFVQIDVHPIKS